MYDVPQSALTRVVTFMVLLILSNYPVKIINRQISIKVS